MLWELIFFAQFYTAVADFHPNLISVQVYFDLKNQVHRRNLGERVQLLRLAFGSFLLISQ